MSDHHRPHFPSGTQPYYIQSIDGEMVNLNGGGRMRHIRFHNPPPPRRWLVGDKLWVAPNGFVIKHEFGRQLDLAGNPLIRD